MVRISAAGLVRVAAGPPHPPRGDGDGSEAVCRCRLFQDGGRVLRGEEAEAVGLSRLGGSRQRGGGKRGGGKRTLRLGAGDRLLRVDRSGSQREQSQRPGGTRG